jgi:two-component system NtrC family response regulator
MRNVRILLVEDDESWRDLTRTQLEKAGYETTVAANAHTALSLIEKSHYDLTICDLNLPDGSGMDILQRVRAESPETIVLMMTGYGTIESAVQAMKAGAYDYLTKPIYPYALNAVLTRALEHRRLTDEVAVLRRTLDEKFAFDNILGHSAAVVSMLDRAARVAQSDVTVLIRGETGTGKELLAKAIHFNSPRRQRPFVTINCGAIPSELLESELFGHLKGSFTGAWTHKKGRVEAADGGTVFLDEIGEMPLDLQVRILRLLQEHEIEKVGAAAAIKVDVRIIAATHRNLESLVEQGAFREDLYYRVSVVPIELPPLRTRATDIPEFVFAFFERSKREHGKPDLKLSPDLVPYFCSYKWPGNVRQLENTIERIVVLSRSDIITLEDLPGVLRPDATPPEPMLLPFELPEQGLDLDAVEHELIVRVLRKFEGNQSRAARYLNIPRKTLLYRMAKHGINAAPRSGARRPAGPPPADP